MTTVPEQPIIDRDMRAPTSSRSRVLLADRVGPARHALAGFLDGLEEVELVGEVSDRADVSGALERTHAHTLVIDDRLLRSGGEAFPVDLRVIVLGLEDHPAFAERARLLGADAWVFKDRAGEELPALLERR